MPISLRKLRDGARLEWLTLRWWQRAIMWLFWPLMFVGTLYVLLFFFLNSSTFARIVEAQLDAAMMGDWSVGDVSVDAGLTTLRIDSVQLYTPEGEPVIDAGELVVALPWGSLYSLVDSNHLDLHGIKLRRAEVLLDFDYDGPFNLLRALAPAQPSDDTESDFSLALHDIDLGSSHVVLRFDGFEIELHEVEVDDYTLRVGQDLQMRSALHPAGLGGVRVGRGAIRFEPGMFGSPLDAFGAPDTGLGGSFGAGRAGYVAGMTTLAATALHNSCARTGAHSAEAPLCAELGERPVRGDLVVHFADAEVHGFWWMRSTFGFNAFRTQLLEPDAQGELAPVGELWLDQPWMNVGPTAAEVEQASESYGHALPETLPEDTILYYAAAHVELAANSRALAWFFGPYISSPEPLVVAAQVSGDLGNAEGMVSVRAERLEVVGLEVENVSVSGTLEGQRFELAELSADALGGMVQASGHYLILDGDFAADVELGAISAETVARDDGVDVGRVVTAPEVARYVEGELLGALRVSQEGGRLEVRLREPLRLELAQPLPYSGASQVVLEQSQAALGEDAPPLITLENRVVRTRDELRLRIGEDELTLEAGAALWLDALELEGLVARLDLSDIGQYLDDFGIAAQTNRLIVTARASGPLLSPTASVTVGLRGGRGFGIDVPRLDLDVSHTQGRLEVRRLAAHTSLGELEASGWITAFGDSLLEPRDDMPLNFEADASGLRLETLPWLEPYGDLRGAVELSDVQVRGSTRKPQIRGRVSARDLSGFGQQVPRLDTRVRFDGSRIEADDLTASYLNGDDLSAEVKLRHGRFDLSPVTVLVEDLEADIFQDASGSDPALEARVTLGRGRFDLARLAVEVEALDARYTPQGQSEESSARLTLETARVNLDSGRFAFDALELSALRLHDLRPLRAALPQLQATVALRGSGVGDLDALLGAGGSVPTTLDAQLEVRDAVWGERRLGSLELSIDSPEPDIVELTGSIAVEHAPQPLALAARAELGAGHAATARLSFSDLELLDVVPELAQALNGDPTVHRSRFREQPPRVQTLNISGAVEAGWSRAEGIFVDVVLRDLASIVLGQVLVSRGEVLLHYGHNAETLEIRRLEIENSGKSLMLYGNVGLDGTLDVELTGELNAQLARMAGDIIVEARGSLGLGVHAVGDVLDAAGKVQLDGLDLTGFVAVRDPLMLRIRGLGEPVEVERGVLQIAEARDCPRSGEACYLIPQEKAFAGSVLGGGFELSGEIGRINVFEPVSAELLATAEDLSLRIKDTLTLTFDVPELRLFVLDLADLKTVPPQLYGAVEITEGRYYKNHLVQSEIFEQSLSSFSKADRREERFETPIWQRLPELAAVEINITVDSESGFRIDNEVAGARVDLELEFNNLHLGGTLKDLEPSGVVNIRDGEVIFRQNRFEVLPGAQLRFNESLDAVVDVAAQAEISTQSSFASSITGGTTRDRRNISTSDLARGSTLYIVTLTVTGALSELAWTLESNPFLATNNIVYLVLTGQTLEDATGDSPIGTVALEQLIAPLFESQVDNIISADQLKFQFAEGAAQFSYIQQINRALRIAAGVAIRGAEGNESAIAGEYRFDDRLLLELVLQDAVEDEGKAPRFSIGGRLEWRIPLD